MTRTASTDKANAAPAKTAEPRLEDLLEDTAMQLLMARDGVSRDDLLELVARVRAAIVRRKRAATQWQHAA